MVIKLDDELIGAFDDGNAVYRLSYMLYPYFHIIQTTSKDVISLDEILNQKEQ